MQNQQNKPYLHIHSEVGPLRRVLLHRPGAELEHLFPRHLGEMLFEDMPWLARMQEEHDAFAQTLRDCGAEVVYVEDLLTQIFGLPPAAETFIDQILDREIGRDMVDRMRLREFFLACTPGQMTAFAIGGIFPADLGDGRDRLSRYLPLEGDYLLSPLPNLYFSRDPAVAVGSSLILCAMQTAARQREGLLMQLLTAYHPDWKDIPLLYDTRQVSMTLEGGDVLALCPTGIAVGCSQRTSVHAVDHLARQLFRQEPGYTKVLAIHIPSERAFMHLDTVMTMVDQDTFVIYPRVGEQMEVVEITPGAGDALTYRRHDHVRQGLRSLLGYDVRMIESGGGDPLVAAREQWNDATNTLAVAPGRVVVYDRNTVSNRCLRQAGIDAIEIAGSELVRGRGGPRCISMPLYREEL